MQINEYQERAKALSVYRGSDTYRLAAAILDLGGKVGELCQQHGRQLQGDRDCNEITLTAKLGDVLFSLALLASELHIPLGVLANHSLRKHEKESV